MVSDKIRDKFSQINIFGKKLGRNGFILTYDWLAIELPLNSSKIVYLTISNDGYRRRLPLLCSLPCENNNKIR